MANSKIQDKPADPPAFVTWGDDDASRENAMGLLSEAVDSFVGISHGGVVKQGERGHAGYYQDLSDLASNVSSRPGLSRSDYDKFRPDERVATKFPNIINEPLRYREVCGYVTDLTIK